MNDTFLYQAMCAGARGYLNEKMRGDHLTNALDTVCQGGYWAERHILCQFISDKSMNDKIEDNAVKLFSRLTKREAEVLGKVLEGLSTHEIAERIYLSHQGVKAHLTNLFRKFEVKNRVQLILKALDEISPVSGLTEIASNSLKLKADKIS
jgi:DNA-binding NarL/FixJ family response regulator